MESPKLKAYLLRLNIIKAAWEALIRSQYPDEQFSGYALYSDHDAITILPPVNTSRHLEGAIGRNPLRA